MLSNNSKTYMIITEMSFPFGGGEEYMMQTCNWMYQIGYKSIWISFYNSKRQEFKIPKIKVIKEIATILIEIPGGFNSHNLENWLKLLRPDIIHHQGGMREKIFQVAKKLRIEFLTGFHFWSGGIILDSTILNKNILENSHLHKPDPEFLSLYQEPHCNFYVVSKFVQECFQKITNITITKILYSASSYQDNYIDYDINMASYVTVVNIHKFKGGMIVYNLIKTLKDIPFLCVQTEHGSEELDNLIKTEIELRESNPEYAKCKYLPRQQNLKEIFKITKILLQLSQVDETFCRVVNEAMLNGIPVISTGKGNIKNLLGDKGIIIDSDETELWCSHINKLYNNKIMLDNYSNYMKLQYQEFSEEKAKSQFLDYVDLINKKSKNSNLMIMVPWCDQGLGIQARNYYQILKESYQISIFGIKPYNKNSCLELQKNQEEWIVENIYYSDHDREHITDMEIIDFVHRFNIGKCIIPETCWFRIFEIAKLLRNLDVKVYAIPNIEIVRKDELMKHKYFYKILCNNYLSQNIFHSYNIKNTHYIGYGINNFYSKNLVKNNKLKFLFIGGMNAFSRKQILNICESIVKTNNPDIELTCTIQMTNNLEVEEIDKLEKYKMVSNIRIITEHLAYETIMELYQNHHISIQVSKHEGLGLGFYEALSTGTPVITLDTPPHHEIIQDGKTGWIIPCYYKPMTDNTDPLFESAYFDSDVLANKINEIYDNYDNIIDEIHNNIMKFNLSNYQNFIRNLDMGLEK